MICGKGHFHPIDIKAEQISDSLKNKGVDTILIYRHWLGMNGFNGYGKVLWVKNGLIHQYFIDFKNHIDDYRIKSINYSEVWNPIFSFFFQNKIDTIKTSPKSKTQGPDHDSNHFIQIIIGVFQFCFDVDGQALKDDPSHPYSQMIALVFGK